MSVVVFFSPVTEENRRVLALLWALVPRLKTSLLFELPRVSNMSCCFQAVHVPSGKEIWKERKFAFNCRAACWTQTWELVL